MTTSRANDQRRWIISPFFDLCFVINLWWLLALLPQPSSIGVTQSTSFEFWQVYFLTTPHRWLTLILVATDPDRRQGRTSLFISMAIIAAVLVAATWQLYGAFTCLILVDFIWNAWHFASQHGGILRIYGRMGGGGYPNLERYAFRTFVTYTALRTAGWLTGWTEDVSWARSTMLSLDFLVLILPVVLLSLEFCNRPLERLGKVLYLSSVLGMYGATLFAIRNGQHYAVIALVVASAAFHSVEYMAIVTFYARRRCDSGSNAPFQRMARNWLRILTLYIICIGVVSRYTDSHLKDFYIGINLWAAFLHYAYDGMIWKLRRPETAKALDVQLKPHRPETGRANG
ncbi:MAG: hypothetical protein GY768_06570 [Planctomycetaceae bacterium]|nr:hypothetical protein [Planctomycetaceae bacterium]